MPTILTHAVLGAAIAQVLAPPSFRRTLTWVCAGCAMLPDADVVGFGLGVAYGDMLGHRGITHSVLFAGLAGLSTLGWFRQSTAALCVFLATVSHGLLDALTNGGLGVAFFAPFSAARYFFPVTPIPVSPIGARFFSARGVGVLVSEVLWVWLPVIVILLAARFRPQHAPP